MYSSHFQVERVLGQLEECSGTKFSEVSGGSTSCSSHSIHENHQSYPFKTDGAPGPAPGPAGESRRSRDCDSLPHFLMDSPRGDKPFGYNGCPSD